MSQHTLEDRVSALEAKLAGLVASVERGNGGWRSTIGMFADDPVMREIQEEGRRIREAERRQPH